jgi:hypothetical protein
MAIDPSIAMGYRGLGELPNPMNQLAQVSQIQSSQRQGEMAQMQIQQMRRDNETLRQIQAKAVENGGPSDLNQIAEAYLKSGNPKFVEFGIGLRQKLDEKTRFAEIMGRKPPAAAIAAPAAAPMAAPEPGSFGADVAARREADPFARPQERTNMMPGVVAAPAGVNAMVGSGANNAAEIAFKQQQRNDLISEGTPRSIAAAKAIDADIALLAREPSYQNVPGVGLVNPRDMSVVMPSVESTDPVIKQYNLAVSQGFKGSILDYKREIARAGRAPAAPRPEQPPVAVVDPATGKTVYVSREEALGQRMTPASAMEGLAPKEIQKREAALPAATAAVTGFDAKAKSFIKDLIALRDDDGLNQITGPVYGRTGSVSRAGSRAQGLYDKVVAKGGFQALQDLRDASKTGGALGNVSNQEGKQLTASFAAIDRRQDARDVQAAINQAIADIEGARTRTREAYDNTYSYKSPAGQATPSPAAATIPQAAIDALNAGKGTPAEFDAQFGAGAAARVKGKR